jgi:purine-binding chemotaxis protein CheW
MELAKLFAAASGMGRILTPAYIYRGASVLYCSRPSCDRGTASEKALKTVVIIRCGTLVGAVERTVVREIAPVPELSHPPSLPTSVQGVMNLAGQAVLVVDLAALMGVEEDAETDPVYHHLVVLAGERDGLALRVTRVEDVRAIDESALVRAQDGGSFNGCVVGHVDVGGRQVHLLDADRIFLAAERQRLADLQQMEQARLDALVAP